MLVMLKLDVVLLTLSLTQGKYLRLLQPQQLPTLLKSSLTAQLVSGILTAALTAAAAPPPPAAAAAGAGDDSPSDADACQQLTPQHAVSLIQGLAAVPRFDMMVMSLSSRDKAALKQLFELAAGAVDSLEREQLAAVRPKYRL
jgi:hypothetical protein